MEHNKIQYAIDNYCFAAAAAAAAVAAAVRLPSLREVTDDIRKWRGETIASLSFSGGSAASKTREQSISTTLTRATRKQKVKEKNETGPFSLHFFGCSVLYAVN